MTPYRGSLELIQGTLGLLILKTLTRDPHRRYARAVSAVLGPI